jgi:hypothetical protein
MSALSSRGCKPREKVSFVRDEKEIRGRGREGRAQIKNTIKPNSYWVEIPTNNMSRDKSSNKNKIEIRRSRIRDSDEIYESECELK